MADDKKNLKNTTENPKGVNNASKEVNKFSPAQIKQFSLEVKSEFYKIVWPDRKHTFASTGVVIVLVTLISFYLGAVDLILGKLISFILK